MKEKDEEGDINLILENIADVVLESHNQPPCFTDDPFDFYVQRVQSGLFSKEDLFRERFVKGYHVLMSEVNKP